MSEVPENSPLDWALNTEPDSSSSSSTKDVRKFGEQAAHGIEAQYVQMQESRRQWERFVWQSPIITTTLVGISFAVLAGRTVPYFCGNMPLAAGFLLLSAFTFVVGLWGHRSRLLLRATEKTLFEIEKDFFSKSYPKFAFQVENGFRRPFDRISSTLIIVSFMFCTAFVLMIFSSIEMSLAFRGMKCGGPEKAVGISSITKAPPETASLKPSPPPPR